MKGPIDINGKKLLPIREVISTVDYSRDYVTRLARERKIVATQIGRVWYIDPESLSNYQKISLAEQEIKKRRLSDDRKRQLAIKEHKERKQVETTRCIGRRVSASVMMIVVLVSGLGVGVTIESVFRSGFTAATQLANIKTLVLQTDGETTPDVAVQDYVHPSAASLVPEFTPNVTQRRIDADQGVLLLPHGSGSVPVAEYFSDPVEVIYDSNGEPLVRRVGDDGEPLGDVIPYVIVPVNTNSP